MKFNQRLLEGTFLKRYKRFFADIEHQGQVITAHTPNSGSMKGCNTPHSACRFYDHGKTDRKLRYTLEMIKTPTSWVGVNTMRPNALMFEAWQNQLLKDWKGFDRAQREVKISDKSRIDLVLWKSRDHQEEKLLKPDFKKLNGPFHFVEIKNVSMAEGNLALFPDSVTERGQKHLKELMTLQKMGHSTEILFVVQREDCQSFSPADDIDPEYGKLLRQAKETGVRLSCYTCKLSPTAIEITPKKLKIVF